MVFPRYDMTKLAADRLFSKTKLAPQDIDVIGNDFWLNFMFEYVNTWDDRI